MIERFERSFSQNPIAWILAILLAFSVYSNYRTGKEFTKTCQLVQSLTDDFLDTAAIRFLSRTNGDYEYKYKVWEELQSICTDRLTDDPYEGTNR